MEVVTMRMVVVVTMRMRIMRITWVEAGVIRSVSILQNVLPLESKPCNLR